MHDFQRTGSAEGMLLAVDGDLGTDVACVLRGRTISTHDAERRFRVDPDNDRITVLESDGEHAEVEIRRTDGGYVRLYLRADQVAELTRRWPGTPVRGRTAGASAALGGALALAALCLIAGTVRRR